MQQNIDKELLKKYLMGSCTPSELQQVGTYLLRPGTREILDELIVSESEAEWNQATEVAVELDEQMKGWQAKFERRKEAFKIAPEIQPVPGFFQRNNMLKYAAVISMFILGIGFFTLNKLKENTVASSLNTAKLLMKEFSTAKGQRATITLVDGTKVYMGAASTLKYPEQFKDSIRNISLQGEAFFEVAHNPQKPFIIQTHQIYTRVLGTSFKINAIEDRPFEVQVATGKVRVDRIKPGNIEHLAVLTPGQQVSLNTLNGMAVTGQAEVKDIKEWKNSILVFKDQSLAQIATQLERAYDVKFSFRNAQTAKEVVTVTLQDNIPLNQTLRILGAGAGFKYSIDGKNIIIK